LGLGSIFQAQRAIDSGDIGDTPPPALAIPPPFA
jgi:hypothetical protein